MRLSSIVSEAVRNVGSGTTRAGLLALALGVVAASLALVDLLAVHGQQVRAQIFDSSGASIRVLAVEQRVDGDSCEALTASAVVNGSGALRARSPVTLLAVPRNPVPGYSVTPGLHDVLGVEGSGEGVWLPEQLAHTLGVAAGDRLATDSGELRVAGTFPWPDDGRDARLRHAVLVPEVPAGRFDECWARSWPLAPAADELVRTAARVDRGGAALTISQVNNSFGALYDPHAELAARPSRHLGVGSAAAGFVLGLVSTRRRRLEHASALHAGQGRGAQLATASLEAVAWAGVGALVASGALHAVAAVLSPTDAAVLAQGQLTGPFAVLVTVPLGAAAGVAATTQAHLFRYFKDRA